MKKQTCKRALTLLLATTMTIFVISAPALAVPKSGIGQYDTLEEIFDILDDYALYPPDDLSLDGITAAALENNPDLFWEIIERWLAPDPYGGYILHDDYAFVYGMMEGVYGIGVSIDSYMPLGLYVVDILPGGAAESSGIEIGAQIVEVDGVNIADVNQYDARHLTMGEEGSNVVIGYINPGSADVIFETITRGPLIPVNVIGDMIEGTDVGYIRISQFGVIDDATEFDYLFNEFLPEQGASSVIIDLRGNPGGELNTVLNMMNVMILEEGYLLITLVDSYGGESFYSTGFNPVFLALLGLSVWQPEAIVFLVDEYSASASEIMAGTFQSHGFATVVGMPTFGKAHSQYHIELECGDYLVFTFSRIELYDIGTYEGIGIIPSHIVSQQTFPGTELNLRPLDTGKDLLRDGEPEERVSAMQERLAVLGFYRTLPSGVFDDYTLWCFNRFQAVYGLMQGEYADSESLKLLVSAIDEATFYSDTQLAYALSLLSDGFDSSFWVNVYSDVDDTAWYYDGIAYVTFYKYMNGTGEGVFSPGGTMNRAMFAQMLYNIESSENTPVLGASNASFSDVNAPAWYYDAVTWAASHGIVAGSGGKFDPLRPVTRQEIALMLYRYATEFKGLDIPSVREMPDFQDAGQIADWAGDAARALSEAGVINGIGDLFAPARNATRAEVSLLLMNFMLLVVANGN
ncbi:MAG: S41 family peptidase [Oscillospiraceae bacterium]|nr:S41 family peptidase [Oscillospiraceae bacterium]